MQHEAAYTSQTHGVTLATPFRCVTILPPAERFAPGEAGAIALLVRRMAHATQGTSTVESVLGQPPSGQPFTGVPFTPVTPLWAPFSKSRRYAWALARQVKRLKPDILEVHNRPDIALMLRRFLPSLPIMLVLHNDPCGMRRAKTAQERTQLAKVVSVVGVSEWVRQRFLSQGVQGSVQVLPNSLNLAEIPPPLMPREKTLLFAGRIVADKGADIFVKACAQVLPHHPAWCANMIGADRFGPNSPETPFLAALRPQAQQAGVVLLGYQTHTAVLEAMARAAVVVVPSRWPEPFGMVALEAMACGAALLVSNKGGLPDVVGEAGLLCDPDNLPEVVAKLTDLITNEALRAELAQKGLERAQFFQTDTLRLTRESLQRACIAAWRTRCGG